MNRKTEYMAWAVASLALGIASVVFGVNLLPPAETVASRLGTAMPLFLTWGMIGIIAVAAVSLAAFLLTAGLKEKA
jgi:hypothetical protein